MSYRTQIFIIISLSIQSVVVLAQPNSKVSTIDFVAITNGNRAEALYFYNENWARVRELAKSKEMISDYKIMSTTSTEEAPFDLILITTYANVERYEQREENFEMLMEQLGEPNFLNTKRPNDFRTVLFSKSPAGHLETKDSD